MVLEKIFGDDKKPDKKKLPGKKKSDVQKGSTGHVIPAMQSEIAFVLDRSGSMGNYTSEAIDGFNDFVDSQQQVPGDASLTLCLFDDDVSVPMNGVDLKDADRLNRRSYQLGGSTALYDAIGKTMGEMMIRHSQEGHPARVVMAILTDGYENASSEYTAPIIKDMVHRAKHVYGWEFIIIGVGVNAEQIAADMGIEEHCALPENGTRDGVQRAFAEAARSIAHFRKTGDIKLLKAKN